MNPFCESTMNHWCQPKSSIFISKAPGLLQISQILGCEQEGVHVCVWICIRSNSGCVPEFVRMWCRECVLTVAVVLFERRNACNRGVKGRMDRGPWPHPCFGTSGALRGLQGPTDQSSGWRWVSWDEGWLFAQQLAQRGKQQGPRLSQNLRQANPERTGKAMHDKREIALSHMNTFFFHKLLHWQGFLKTRAWPSFTLILWMMLWLYL